MRFQSYLNTATQLLQSYTGEFPFAGFIKAYFSEHKKFGSSDRKHISRLCYAGFRLGQALKTWPWEQRIVAGLFLCSQEPNELLEQLQPEWNKQTALTPEEKFSLISGNDGAALLSAVFSWQSALSEGIAYPDFARSFFIQPDLFLRMRPGREDIVQKKLIEAGIPFEKVSDSCLALPNSSKADKAILLNKDAVIQDLNSQRVGEFIATADKAEASETNTKVTGAQGAKAAEVWDCCSGSGGKSIMAWDLLKNIKLTVSDVRESILVNLKERFQEAGISPYTSFKRDLLKINSPLPVQKASIDLLITDVPCSGSGTWGRTPDDLCYFNPQEIEVFSDKQKQILTRVIPYLAPGGYLLYITCSVFSAENEEVVKHVTDTTSLILVRLELLKGYDKKADTLFAALFKAPHRI